MKLSTPRKKETPENIIPLINVVFLLLIFFMISAKLASHDSIEITPPVSSVAVEEEQQDGPVIFLTSSGAIYYEESEMALKDLISDLEKDDTALPGAKLLIKADAHAPADALLRLLTALRETPVGQVELVTQTQP